MANHDEISRFSSNGKTFFFNKAEAKNGSPYLAINAIYGRGNQERMVLFEPHMLEFRRHLDKAIGKVLGIVMKSEGREVVPEIAPKCPNCEFECGAYEVMVWAPDTWNIYCSNCSTVLYESGGSDG